MTYAPIQVGNFPRIGNKAPVITFHKSGLIRISKWAAIALNVQQGDHFEILLNGKSLAVRKSDKSNKHSLRIQMVRKKSDKTTPAMKVSNRVLIKHIAEVCDWPFGPGRLTDIQFHLQWVEDLQVFELV